MSSPKSSGNQLTVYDVQYCLGPNLVVYNDVNRITSAFKGNGNRKFSLVI